MTVAVANNNSDNVSVLLNNGNGTFQTAANYDAGDYPIVVFAVDLDGDSDNDLSVANHFSDNVSVLMNLSNESIPTLSEWGMIVLALLILSIGTVAVIRRRKVVTIECRQ